MCLTTNDHFTEPVKVKSQIQYQVIRVYLTLLTESLSAYYQASRAHLITGETDKLQQLECPRGQHGNHLQEELKGGFER